MTKIDFGRVRKALMAALAAAVAAFGAGMAEGGDWRAAAGMALAAAVIAGGSTYAVPNRLGSQELYALAEQAAARAKRGRQ